MAELLDRYGGLVYSLARRFCYESSEIEDAVEEVFIAIWQSAGRFDASLGSEETFVSMLARRRLIDRRRRSVRRRAGQVDADVSVMVDRGSAGPDGRDGAERALEHSEVVARAENVLNQLKPEQRECLRLSIYQGLSHEEIAQATGIPLGTVKTHVRRGLIAVREALAPSLPNPESDETSGAKNPIGRSSVVSVKPPTLGSRK